MMQADYLFVRFKSRHSLDVYRNGSEHPYTTTSLRQLLHPQDVSIDSHGPDLKLTDCRFPSLNLYMYAEIDRLEASAKSSAWFGVDIVASADTECPSEWYKGQLDVALLIDNSSVVPNLLTGPSDKIDTAILLLGPWTLPAS
jgi:hypothetical protein